MDTAGSGLRSGWDDWIPEPCARFRHLIRISSWYLFFFFSSRRRHTRFKCDWSSDVCSSDLLFEVGQVEVSGVTVGAPEVSAALQRAAQGMSTLDINNDALRRAAGRFPTVSTITVDSSPPHTLKAIVS